MSVLPRTRHRWVLIGIVLLAVLLVCCTASSRALSAESRWQQRGFALPTWTRDGYADPAMEQYLREIVSTGADWIQFTPTEYQRSDDANTIAPTSQTATDDGVERAISLAHKYSLKVLLKPLVDVSGSPGSQAEIDPSDRDAWFSSFTSFISNYADIAARFNVEEFSVGTELAGVSDDRARWLKVIQAVRARYQGTLVYAANFNEYSHVSFWDKLDLIGIDAYWSLSQHPTAKAAKLERAWQPIRAQLAAFAAKNHRRILFTEAGYTSERGTTTLPYSWTISQTPDQAEQAAAYQALLATFTKQRWWAGVFWWVWDVLPDDGSDHTLDFTPRGKAAENVVRRWWAD
jgi:hypothetical protein